MVDDTSFFPGSGNEIRKRAPEAEVEERSEAAFQTALREAFKAVLVRIPENVTATDAARFHDEENLVPGKRWSAEDINLGYLQDAAVEINCRNIEEMLRQHVGERMGADVGSVSDRMRSVSESVGVMSENAFKTADIVIKREWGEMGSKTVFAESAQHVVTLIELMGGGTDSAILVKSLYAGLLFQAFNARRSWNNIMIRSGESTTNRIMNDATVLRQVEYQMNNGFMKAVGAKRAVLGALNEVPYVADVGFAAAEDEASGSHIVFRIDPRKYAEQSRISKFPNGFYDFFDGTKNTIEVGEYGFSDEKIESGVEVALMQFRESGNDVIYFHDGRYSAVVSVVFDRSLEKEVSCRLGAGSVSFSQIDFDGIPATEPGRCSGIPEAIVRRYVGFKRGNR